jgi:hypothetical protein
MEANDQLHSLTIEMRGKKFQNPRLGGLADPRDILNAVGIIKLCAPAWNES